MIAAIGEAGEGKSTLLNLILNSPGESRELFAVSEEPEACTTSPSVRSGHGTSGTLINILDWNKVTVLMIVYCSERIKYLCLGVHQMSRLI